MIKKPNPWHELFAGIVFTFLVVLFTFFYCVAESDMPAIDGLPKSQKIFLVSK